MVCAVNWPKNKFCAVIGSLARSGLAVPKFSMELGRVSNFDQSID